MHEMLRITLLGLLALSLAGCLSTPTKTAQQAVVPAARSAEPVAAAPAPPQPTPAVQPPAPEPPGDVWERIRAGFSLTIPENRRIDQLLHVYRDQERMDRIQRRAAPWLRHIVDQLEQRGLPLELALLPAVESAYQARVFSPRGAAGIWQFMGATGGQYGLERNWWYDGRMDVVDSTRAALDYLSWLQRRYHGDWLLALAAYNSGIRTVDRAIRHNRRLGRPTDFWHLRLPRETRSYVPQWLALLRIVREPQRHGVTLHPVPDTEAFATLTIDKPIDLRVAARLTGIALADLVALNPGLKHLHTGTSKGYRLHLPADKAADFRARLDSIPASEFSGFRPYRVKPGDMLSRIAQREGISVAAIVQANGLTSSRLRIGQQLRLPIAESAKSVRKTGPSRARHKPARLAKGRSGTRHKQPKAGGIAYRVRNGDSLWTISRRFDVPIARLAAWNQIAINQTLRPGQVLRIHAGKPGKGATRIHYRVRKGDSLYLIARRFQVPMKQLQSWNDLNDKHLMPGQKLTLYLE